MLNYIYSRGRVRMLSGGLVGLMLLLSLFVRFIDGAIGMAFLFGVTMYISAKVKKYAKAVTGVLPGELPPLLDPSIFSRPMETAATAPGPEVVERSSAE